MKMKKHLLFMIMLLACILLINPSRLMAEAESKLIDIDNHWAAMPIKAMVNEGIVNGYPDNTFRPDHAISRAEFITIINKAYRLTATAEINYPDVDKADWFWEEISKAKAAGYLSGYADGTIKPRNTITRQEAAVIIARTAKMNSGNESELAAFKDCADIPAWSRGALAALTEKGYIGGYPDGTIQAARTINRAETVVLLAKATAVRQPQPVSPESGMELDKPGYYGSEGEQKDINGSVTIRAAGVVLQHSNISGDLLITEAVGDGDVTLKNVSIKGITYINGGGASTVTIDGCELGKTIINKKNGNIRILLTGRTSITELHVDSTATVAGPAKINKAVINADKVVIEAKPDSFIIRSGITAMISGQTQSGTPSYTGGGSSDGHIIPDQVESLAVNQLFGMTFVTVKLKAELAASVDEVFITGEQAFTQDGISYKKTLPGSVARNAIAITVKTITSDEQFTSGLIVPSGCFLEYIPGTDKSQVQVQTGPAVTAVTANDNPMQKTDGQWQCELEGELTSVTVIASDGTNSETYILANSK